MICNNCGKYIENGAAFCPACGNKMTLTNDSMNDGSFDVRPAHHKTEAETDIQTNIGSSYSQTAAIPAAPGTASAAPVTAAQYEQPYLREPPQERVVTGSPSYPMCHTTGDARAAQPVTADRMMPPKPKKQKQPKQKEFFGKGAFVFCLVIIALLAGTSGVFASLYFSAIGVI